MSSTDKMNTYDDKKAEIVANIVELKKTIKKTLKKTITFTRTTEREVSFADWYDEVKDKYPVKADAKKVWARMCYIADTSDQYQYREIDNCEDLEWFEFEDKLEELEEEAKEADEVSDKKPEASADKPNEA